MREGVVRGCQGHAVQQTIVRAFGLRRARAALPVMRERHCPSRA
ncbi:hypothetical protein [Streptosporangium sp. NBC_01469]|nr:hypothetical protein [Streptosporangium sp. NBC_01469]